MLKLSRISEPTHRLSLPSLLPFKELPDALLYSTTPRISKIDKGESFMTRTFCIQNRSSTTLIILAPVKRPSVPPINKI